MQKLIRLNAGQKLKMSREGLSITLLYSPFMFLDAGVLLLLSHWRCLSNGPLMVGSLNLTKVFGTEPFLLDRNKIRSDYMLVGGAICVSESSVGAHWVEVLLGLEWGWGDFLLHTSKYKWTWPTFHFLGAEFVGLIFCLLNDLLCLGWSSAASFSSSPWQKCNHRPTISLSPSLIVYGLENNPLFHPQRGRVGHFLQNSVLFI